MDSIIRLNLGEHCITPSEKIISTILGSCISVCLYDEENDINGMNHFVLPEQGERSVLNRLRYGEHSLPGLIKDMIGKGALKENLRAKVFGGGNVISHLSGIGRSNIEYVKNFLTKEEIPIINEDLGGSHGRHIYFDTMTKKVYVKRIS